MPLVLLRRPLIDIVRSEVLTAINCDDYYLLGCDTV
jgi:hypothetical protein